MRQEKNSSDRDEKLTTAMERTMTEYEKYMKEAIKQAKKGKLLGEVPIGCVIVYKDKIIGRGYNRRNMPL